MLVIATVVLGLTLLGPRAPAPRAPVTGTYGYGTYGRTSGRSGAGCVLRVWQAGVGTRVDFDLDCTNGPPSHSLGWAGGTTSLRRGVAVYRAVVDGEPCTLRLAFAGAAVRVEQTGTCAFGRGVYASGVYRRLSRARPRFDDPS